MKPTLTDAIILATKAHKDQFDKIGEPYILHPIRVMLSLSSPIERIVAILHDVLEDTDITDKDLFLYGYSEKIIDAIKSVSKVDGEKYFDFIKRCCENKIGINVKRADISDNMSPIRLYKLDVNKRIQLREKYVKAINLIDKFQEEN
jgi:(p)ppGpp synthase/HD superfamily hydrolase